MKQFIAKVSIVLGVIYIFIQYRKQEGFWYLYQCPRCGKRRVYKKWVNDPDPQCAEETCQTTLIRIL